MISSLEVIWVVIALFGALFSNWGLQRARTEMRELKTHKVNGLRQFLSSMDRRREFIRTTIHVLFLGLGIVAMASPSPPISIDTRVMVTRYATIGVFMFVNLLILYGSIRDFQDHRKIYERGDEMAQDWYREEVKKSNDRN